MLLFHATQLVLASRLHMHMALAPLRATAPSADVFTQLEAFATDIENFLKVIGGTAFLIGVTIAAIMRMLAFGSERRVAMSNMALSAAIIGLVILLLATGIQTLLTGKLGG